MTIDKSLRMLRIGSRQYEYFRAFFFFFSLFYWDFFAKLFGRKRKSRLGFKNNKIKGEMDMFNKFLLGLCQVLFYIYLYNDEYM